MQNIDPALRISKNTKREPVTGCLLWTRGTNRKGYGTMKIRGQFWLVHRWVFWTLTNSLPEVVMHTCDTPPCVEPTHLKAGTRLENAQDRDNKGRGWDRRGEVNGSAKLTQRQVNQIRIDYTTSTVSHADLAKIYQVSSSLIGAIVREEVWK